jgi:hypothetical protein
MIRLSLFFVPLAALVAAVPAPACAPAPRQGQEVTTVDEGALIVWDAKNKVEHFVRKAHFRATGYDFGFLVPTPKRPLLDIADDAVFDALSAITAAKIEYREEVRYTDAPFGGFGCGGMFPGAKFAAIDAAGAPKSAPRAGGVDVLETKRVGDYDAAVLVFRAGDGDNSGPKEGAEALTKWLQKHGYEATPATAKWLEWYVQNGWCLTAFKVASAPNPADGPPPPVLPKDASFGKGPPLPPRDLNLKPVRMSFRTEKPFYPYREPEVAPTGPPTGGTRKLRVFVAAESRYEGKLGDGANPWPGRTVWAGKPNAETLGSAFAIANGKPEGAKAPFLLPTSAEGFTLTEFEDASSPRPGTDEVYFAPAADQAPVERPVQIVNTVRYEKRTPWWHLAVYIGVPVGVALLGIGVWRLASKA